MKRIIDDIETDDLANLYVSTNSKLSFRCKEFNDINDHVVHGAMLPVDISSFCIRSKIGFIKYTTRQQDNYTLSHLLSHRKVREELSTILRDVDLLTEIVKKACGSTNGIIRMSNKITTNDIIRRKINDTVDNAIMEYTKCALHIILAKAFSKWGLLYDSEDVEVIESNRNGDINDAIKLELSRLTAEQLIESLVIGIVDQNGQPAQTLASVINKSTKQFIQGFANIDRLEAALHSTLARIRAYLTQSIDSFYEKDELAFTTDHTFRTLAGNFNMIQLAMSQESSRPASHSSMWQEQDRMVHEALRTLKHFDLIDSIKPYMETFVIKGTRTSDVQGVVNSINVSNNSSVHAAYAYNVGGKALIEFDATTQYDSLLSPVNRWIKSAAGFSNFNFLSLFCEAHVSHNTNPFVIHFGYDEDIVRMYACELAESVYLVEEDGGYKLAFSNSIAKNLNSSNTEIDNVITSTDPYITIFQKAEDFRGNEGITISDLDIGLNSQRYQFPAQNYVDMTHTNHNVKYDIDLFLSDGRKNYKCADTVNDIFSNYGGLSCSFIGNVAVRHIVDHIISSIDQANALAEKFDLSDDAKSNSMYKTTKTYLEQLIYPLMEDKSIKSLLTTMRLRFLNMPAVKEDDLIKSMRRGNILQDKSIKMQIDVQHLFVLLAMSGVLSTKTLKLFNFEPILNVISQDYHPLLTMNSRIGR